MPSKKALKDLQRATGTKDISWLYDSDFINVYKGKKPHTQVEKQWSKFIKTTLKGGALDYDIIENTKEVHTNVFKQIQETYQFLQEPKAYIMKKHSESSRNLTFEQYVDAKLLSFNIAFNNPTVKDFFDLNAATWRILMQNALRDYIHGTSMHQVYVKPGTVEITKKHELQTLRMFNTALFFAPRLNQDYVVWRGLGLDISPTVNQNFSSPVAMSTSTRSAVSIEWMLERLASSCCLLKITLPAGTPCLWVGKAPMDPNIDESEHKAIETLIQKIFNDREYKNPIHYQYEVILPSGLLQVKNISSIDLSQVLSDEDKKRFGLYWYRELGDLIKYKTLPTVNPTLKAYLEGKLVKVYECTYAPKWATYVSDGEKDYLTINELNSFK